MTGHAYARGIGVGLRNKVPRVAGRSTGTTLQQHATAARQTGAVRALDAAREAGNAHPEARVRALGGPAGGNTLAATVQELSRATAQALRWRSALLAASSTCDAK